MYSRLLNLINKIFSSHAFLLLILLTSSSFSAHSSDSKKVSTALFKALKINITHTLGGVVPAAQDSNISAQISAIINHFHVDTGHEVKKGNLLVSLDCKENQLRLAQSAANKKAEKVQLAHAITQFNQAKKLSKQGNISKETYNQREAEENRLKATLENKKAAVALAQINVDRCLIKAPFDGFITNRTASVGELTQPGSSLLQLVSKTNNIVEVKINHRLLNNFSQGTNFQFTFNNQSYPLQVEFVIPILDAITRSHIARLSFINEPAITGSVGKVKWQDVGASIPSIYIVLRNNKLGVMIADNNTAKFIEINNALEGQSASIKLDDETQIITKGRFNIKNGDKLSIEN